MKPQCMICRFPLEWEFEKYDQVDGGGNVTIICHYGSRHDMQGGQRCSLAAAYICDDCYETLKKTGYIFEEVAK